MKKYRKLLFWFVSSLLIGGIAYYLITDYMIFDHKFYNRINDFDEATHFLKDKRELDHLISKCNLQTNPHSFHTWEDDSILLTISKVDCKCVIEYSETLNEILNNDIVKKIIVLKNGTVVFNLKCCERLYDCDNHMYGYHGDYVHFLSKEPVKFNESKWSNIKAQKKSNGWYYYVVWYSKG